jgi:hypothetical protein
LCQHKAQEGAYAPLLFACSAHFRQVVCPDGNRAHIEPSGTIQLLYHRFDNSYALGDFADIQALALPSARYLDERNGTNKPFATPSEFWKNVRGAGTSFTFGPASILAIQLDDQVATVTVRREFQRFDSNSIQTGSLVRISA